ncbi:uncharacterized protein LOC122327437 [Puntigrus tetrazona]|uniref:uncharacterized protein LOC122327437 n=1 Tax=Puntigrus tetrazona TaxID=1606681 RepID=UPI001C8AC9AB|nr:uncharacterized protein LOC122327437 [Puntigrus tetrazona]
MAASLGGYVLKTNFIVTVIAVLTFRLHGASDVAPNRVSVIVAKGDSVTLRTNITMNPRDRLKWYFIDTLVAQIPENLRYNCTDLLKCTNEYERFGGRLELDHRTGDLTIVNIDTSHADVYQVRIFGSRHIEYIFEVVVEDVPDAETMTISSTEGESVTLDALEVRNPNDVITWYFNDSVIANISGDQSEICEDVDCKERFGDGLTLDHQTGSLIISNTRTTNSGQYQLQIKSYKESYSTTRIRSFTVSVTGSGVSLAVKAVLCVGVFLMLATAAVGLIYPHYGSCRKVEERPRDQRNAVKILIPISEMSETNA